VGITFVDSLISFNSKKLRTVDRSNAEALYRAMAATVAELTWYRHLLKELGMIVGPSK